MMVDLLLVDEEIMKIMMRINRKWYYYFPHWG